MMDGQLIGIVLVGAIVAFGLYAIAKAVARRFATGKAAIVSATAGASIVGLLLGSDVAPLLVIVVLLTGIVDLLRSFPAKRQ